MLQIVCVAAGGALGALLRWWTSMWVHGLAGPAFPLGTLTVNVVGSFAMGVLYVLFADRMHVGPEVRLALTVGLLGALTTFSTFSIETVGLLEDGRVASAMLNVTLSLALCIGACWLGLMAARQL